MRILLADDDTGVIQALLAILKSVPGYEIRVATAGERALENAAALGGVDLLITDVVMEPMDGFTLRDQVLARFPGARTILISGFDLSDYPEQTQFHQVLTKPIDRETLLAAIEQEFAPRAESEPEPVAVRATVHRPIAVPQAAAVRPSAVQAPRAIAAPRAGASGPPAAAAVIEPAAELVDEAPFDGLIGEMLGAYQVLSKLGEGRWGSVYAGVQTAINRPVGLKVLNPAQASDPGGRARFIADARAKAHVQHPAILAVYEAGEADNRIFYAHEYVDGRNMAELKAAGERLDEPTALKVLHTAADGLAYLTIQKIPHSAPEPGSIYLSVDGSPRLANLATQLGDQQLPVEGEIQALGRILLGVLPAIQSLTPGMQDLVKRMVQKGPQAFTAWGQLLQGIKALEPKVVPVEAAKISAQDRAAVAAVAQAKAQQKRSLYLSLISLTGLMILVAGLIYWKFSSNERLLDEQIHIPEGEYLFGEGDPQTLPEFWIDKHEVTYGQYAKFVDFLKNHPTTEYDDPRQPRIKSQDMHMPKDWKIYYGRALAGKPVRSIPIDLNCPIMQIDWWDAAAYAKWKGRELPTEQEWEKAARGTKGFIYPWGDEPDPKKANSNADFHNGDVNAKGEIDGFVHWNPVDKLKGDKSPFGVLGMAGNVTEWIGTWDLEKKRPILKGGSFMSSDLELKRSSSLDPASTSEAIGFRTVTHTPPGK